MLLEPRDTFERLQELFCEKGLNKIWTWVGIFSWIVKEREIISILMTSFREKYIFYGNLKLYLYLFYTSTLWKVMILHMQMLNSSNNQPQ